MAAFGLLILLAGLGMYRLARDYYDTSPDAWPALAAAVAYLYAPYLLTNVFVRAALGEVAAQALLPWIFWSFRRLLRHPEPAAWLLPAALSLALLALSHNITLLLLPPALLAYLVAVWWQASRRPARLAWVAAAGLAAIGDVGLLLVALSRRAPVSGGDSL